MFVKQFVTSIPVDRFQYIKSASLSPPFCVIYSEHLIESADDGAGSAIDCWQGAPAHCLNCTGGYSCVLCCEHLYCCLRYCWRW